MANGTVTAYDWDYTGGKPDEGRSFTLLKEGNYPFTVTGMERGLHEPDARLPISCPQANVSVSIDGMGQGSTDEKLKLPLCSAKEGRISSFFLSLGFPKDAEGNVAWAWGDIVGRTGWCHVRPGDPWVGNDGKTRQSNMVAYFVDPERLSTTGPDEQEPTPPLQPQAAPTAPNPYQPRF